MEPTTVAALQAALTHYRPDALRQALRDLKQTRQDLERKSMEAEDLRGAAFDHEAKHLLRGYVTHRRNAEIAHAELDRARVLFRSLLTERRQTGMHLRRALHLIYGAVEALPSAVITPIRRHLEAAWRTQDFLLEPSPDSDTD